MSEKLKNSIELLVHEVVFDDLLIKILSCILKQVILQQLVTFASLSPLTNIKAFFLFFFLSTVKQGDFERRGDFERFEMVKLFGHFYAYF